MQATKFALIAMSAAALLGTESVLHASINATFTGGSLLINGSSFWPDGDDFAQGPGTVASFSASVSGSTGGGLVEASGQMSAAIAGSSSLTTVSIDATLEGSMPPGYKGFAFLGISTETTDFESDPLRLTINREVEFNIQQTGPGFIEFVADPASSGEIVGDHLLPGSYFIDVSLNVSVNQSNPSATAITDWTLTLSSLCVADISGDSLVNVNDLLAVINQWGGNGSADITGDGLVNVNDLLAVINQWGACP